MDHAKPSANALILTAQVIWFALLNGITVFALIVLFVLGPGNSDPFISYAAAAAAVTVLLLQMVLPLILKGPLVSSVLHDASGQVRADATADRLIPAYQTLMISRLALLEGAAFLALVAYMLEGQDWTLGIAAALWLFIAASFPAAGRVMQWCRTEFETATLAPSRQEFR